MENNTTKSRGSLKALFLIPSIIGVILFMIPVKNADGDWTVVVKIIADIISGAIGGFLPLLCVIILTVSAVMCLVALGKPKFIMDSPILKECFSCGPIWVVIRVLAAIFVWLTYLGVGSEGTGLVSLITSGDQGGFVLYDLLTTSSSSSLLQPSCCLCCLTSVCSSSSAQSSPRSCAPCSRSPAALRSTASPPGSATVRSALCLPATSMKAVTIPQEKRPSLRQPSQPYPLPSVSLYWNK